MAEEEVVDAAEEAVNLPANDEEQVDEVFDQLRLFGALMGQMTLLKIAATGSESAKVSAAKALTQLDEKPAQIVERLKKSVFKDLGSGDLQEVERLIREEGMSPKMAIRHVIATRES